MISIDDFKKVELTVGKIMSAEKVPDTDKLLKLSVSFAEAEPRQIISGIAMHFPEPEKLVGIKCAFVTNLEPRTIRGLLSQGMILTASTDAGMFSLFTVSEDIPEGSAAR